MAERTVWEVGAEIGSEISPWQDWGGLDEQGNLVDWNEQFKAADMTDMLARDGKARSLEHVLTLPVRSAGRSISPAKGDKGEAEFVNAALEAMEDSPMATVVGWGAQALVFRATYAELVYGRREGRVVYERVAPRPTEACSMIHDKDTGALLGYRQELGGPDRFGFVEIPNTRGAAKGVGKNNATQSPGAPSTRAGSVGKAVVFLHGAYRDPMRGASELEVSYRCYTDKQKIRYLWATFLAGAAVPRTVAETPPGQENSVVANLSKLTNAGAVAVPTGTKVTALNVAGNAGADFLAAMTYLDSEMAGSVLAGFTELSSAAGRGSRGSMALAQSETEFFSQSIDAHAQELAAHIRAQIVAPLCRLNFADPVIPKVVIGPISQVSVDNLVTTLQTMAAANADTSIIPTAFVDELTLRVSSLLSLDPDPIRKAIERRAATTPAVPGGTASAPVHAAIATAADAVRRARAGQRPLAAA